jgi:hypothetical protein
MATPTADPPPAAEPVSYDNHIPEAVRRQSQRADELFRTAGAAAVAAPAGGPAPPAPTPAPAPSAPAPPPPPPPPPAPAGETWEQRYATLQGKYNNETTELQTRLRGTETKVASLEGLLAVMNTPAERPAAARSPAAVSPEDVEAYGDELINKSRGWARAEIEPELEQMRQQLHRLQGAQHVSLVETTRDRVNRELDAQIPNWRTVNDSPSFHQWLAQTDYFSGQARQALITDAYGKGDAPRTIAFFKAFLGEHTAEPTLAPTSHTSNPGDAPGNGAGQVSLESLAAPGRGRSVAPGAPQAKRFWTKPEITRFYDDVRRGRVTPQQKAAVEADLQAAMAEGRIQQPPNNY